MTKSQLRNKVANDLREYCNQLLDNHDFWNDDYTEEETDVITAEFEVKYLLVEEIEEKYNIIN
jgi:hypothetical protein